MEEQFISEGQTDVQKKMVGIIFSCFFFCERVLLNYVSCSVYTRLECKRMSTKLLAVALKVILKHTSLYWQASAEESCFSTSAALRDVMNFVPMTRSFEFFGFDLMLDSDWKGIMIF